MYNVWVGKRESDILTSNYFDCSITYYGSNINSNFSFSNEYRTNSNYLSDFTSFVLTKLDEVISANKENTRIHFYNNVFAHKLCEINQQLNRYIVNLNSLQVLNILRHKTLSRVWLSNTLNTPAYTSLSKKECKVDNLIKKFGKYDNFVLQKNFSGGGLGTYLINKKNEKFILDCLNDEQLYLVSPYYKDSKSYSCYLLIDNYTFNVFAVAEQIIEDKNQHLEYRGNYYVSSNSNEYKKITIESTKLAKLLQKIGYRGVCGADFIIDRENVMLVEINPRYLGSSYAVNYKLKLSNLPSLFELSDLCFKNELNNFDLNKLNDLKFQFSNKCYFYCRNNKFEVNELRQQSNVILYEDGFSNAITFEDGVYLYRTLIFF